MFTGIVQTLGQLTGNEPRGGDRRVRVTAPGLDLAAIRPGESIAVNGVCLTAADVDETGFVADVSRETLACTTLGGLRTGVPLNLERALLAGQPLGGHLVSGHVDAVVELLDRREDARSIRMGFALPDELAPLVASKGSVCIDGTSLTVNAVERGRFFVNLIPHTLAATIAAGYAPGSVVNLEVDLVARYLQRLVASGNAAE